LFFFLSIKNKNGPHFLPANHNKTHTTPPQGCYSFSKSIFDYYAATLCTSYIHPGSVCVCLL
jgi:hypothetical protein